MLLDGIFILVSGTNCWVIRILHTSHCIDYFVLEELATVLKVPMIQCLCGLREFLSTDFAACSKLPSIDNHRKVSYPRIQQRDQGEG